MKRTTLLAVASLSAAAITTGVSAQANVDQHSFAANGQRGARVDHQQGGGNRMHQNGSGQLSYVSRGNGHHDGYGARSRNARNRCVHYYHGRRIYRCR